MTVSLANFDPAVANLIQSNYLQRQFLEALMPKLLFRSEAKPEKFDANLGETKIFTRAGMMPVKTTPLIPGQDPQPSSYGTEQFSITPSQYGDRLQTHMPTSRVQISSKFALDSQKLGENSGVVLNQLTRNRLYQSYLAGDTVAIALALSGATQIRVSSLNGFMETLLQGRLLPVSALAPLSIEIGATLIPNTVIAALPDSPSFPYGPGTILLGTALGANVVARTRVRALSRSRVLRQSGVATVDGLTASNILTVNDIIGAVQFLRGQNVPPHSDGYYHVHMPTEAVTQIFQDNHWQRLFQSIPNNLPYANLMISGPILGSLFYGNNECPNQYNVGALTVTGTPGSGALGSDAIGAEVRNESGVPIARTIVTGGGALYEHYIPENEYTTEGGVNGKIGNFNITNNGVSVNTDRIRYIIRAPQDVLQQIYDQAWSWSGDFAVPSDLLTGNGSRFKRAVIIEHAGV